MRLELRKTGATPAYQLLLIATSEEESVMIDTAFGNKIGDVDVIAVVTGTVQLSDGYGEHYIRLEKNMNYE
jgi:hypothetical protein